MHIHRPANRCPRRDTSILPLRSLPPDQIRANPGLKPQEFSTPVLGLTFLRSAEVPHGATSRFDFVLANPPFNVNAVDKERLKDSVGPGRRSPFGLPRADNASYFWIQLFHSALNEKGRAEFEVANSTGIGHSCLMIITEDVRKYAAELGIAEEEALKKGMEEKSREFTESGSEYYAKA